jgi:hypothetical protein
LSFFIRRPKVLKQNCDQILTAAPRRVNVPDRKKERATLRDFVVYAHRNADGKAFYVGSGTRERARSMVGRTEAYRRAVARYGCRVELVESFRDRAEAYAFERELINKLQPECNQLLRKKAPIKRPLSKAMMELAEWLATTRCERKQVLDPNFAQIIKDLRRRMSQDELGQLIGVSQPTIGRLARAADPNPEYGVGHRLIRLHDRLIGGLL